VLSALQRSLLAPRAAGRRLELLRQPEPSPAPPPQPPAAQRRRPAALQLPAEVRALLAEAEEAAKAQQSRASALWDGKMQATQTQSAFGLRVV
jgi:hypothetical protein